MMMASTFSSLFKASTASFIRLGSASAHKSTGLVIGSGLSKILCNFSVVVRLRVAIFTSHSEAASAARTPNPLPLLMMPTRLLRGRRF